MELVRRWSSYGAAANLGGAVGERNLKLLRDAMYMKNCAPQQKRAAFGGRFHSVRSGVPAIASKFP